MREPQAATVHAHDHVQAAQAPVRLPLMRAAMRMTSLRQCHCKRLHSALGASFGPFPRAIMLAARLPPRRYFVTSSFSNHPASELQGPSSSPPPQPQGPSFRFRLQWGQRPAQLSRQSGAIGTFTASCCRTNSVASSTKFFIAAVSGSSRSIVGISASVASVANSSRNENSSGSSHSDKHRTQLTRTHARNRPLTRRREPVFSTTTSPTTGPAGVYSSVEAASSEMGYRPRAPGVPAMFATSILKGLHRGAH